MFVRATLALSAALLLGRLIGFVREVLLAARLGTSAEAEVAIVAMTLPNQLENMLISGGATAALVPALKIAEPDTRAALFRFVASLGLLGGGVLGLFVALFPGTVFDVLAPSLPAEVAGAWHWALILVGLSVPLTVLAALTAAWLNVQERFFAVGLGVALGNLVLCAALLLGGAPSVVATALVFGVLGAALARLGLVLAVARPPLLPRLAPPAGVRPGLARLFAAGVLAVGLIAAGNLVFRSLAGAEGPGALAAFAYALRLYELPIAVVLAPVATVLLPRLAAGAGPGVKRRSLMVLTALGVLVMTVGLTVGTPIAEAIYDRGAMEAEGMADIVTAAKTMYLAIPFAALGLWGAAVLNAAGRTGVVLTNAALALVAGLAVALSGAVLAGFVVFHAAVGLLNTARAARL
ncbi:MAG: lipid II flippase MurJ [Pseudomonadota bacterium]